MSSPTCEDIYAEYHNRNNNSEIIPLPHQRDFANFIAADMDRWKQRDSPPQHGLIAFHAVGSGKTIAQLAAIAQITRKFPEALILIVSKELVLRKNMIEMLDHARSIANYFNLPTPSSKPVLPPGSLPRTMVTTTDDSYATPQGTSGKIKFHSNDFIWPSPARSAADKTGLHYTDWRLSDVFGVIESGPSAGLQRVIGTTSIGLGNELRRAKKHPRWGDRAVVDLFSRPVVLLMDEVQELYQSDEDKAAHINQPALDALRKFMTTQQRNLYNILFTGTLGSSASDIINLTLLTSTHGQQRKLRALHEQYIKKTVTLEAMCRAWATICGSMIHAFSVLRDSQLYPQIEVVPGFDVLHNMNFSDVVARPVTQLVNPTCSDVTSVVTSDYKFVARIRYAFQRELQKQQWQVNKYAAALLDTYKKCVLGEASNEKCYKDVLEDYNLLGRKHLKFTNMIKRLRGMVMYFNTMTDYDMVAAIKGPVNYVSYSTTPNASLQLVRNYALSRPMYQLYCKAGAMTPETDPKRLRSVFARMNTAQLQRASPKIARLVENVTKLHTSKKNGNQLISCLDMAYYNVSDAICGGLLSTKLFVPLHADLAECTSDIRMLLTSKTADRKEFINRIAKRLHAQNRVRYGDILGLYCVARQVGIPVTPSSAKHLKTALLDALYQHELNVYGKLVHIVVLNAEDLFVGWQGRGTAACHIFDVMKMTSVSQFIGRAVRQYPRNSKSAYARDSEGSVRVTCVIIYLNVTAKISNSTDHNQSDPTVAQSTSITASTQAQLIKMLRHKRRQVEALRSAGIDTATETSMRSQLQDIDWALSEVRLIPTFLKHSAALDAIDMLGLDYSMQRHYLESYQEVLQMSLYALYMSRNCKRKYSLCMHTEYPGHPAGFHPREHTLHTCGLPPLTEVPIVQATDPDVPVPTPMQPSFSLMIALQNALKKLRDAFSAQPDLQLQVEQISNLELRERLMQIFD